MAIQGENVFDEDQYAEIRAAAFGKPETAMDAVPSAAFDAARRAVEPFSRVFDDAPIARAYAQGVASGALIVAVSFLLAHLLR